MSVSKFREQPILEKPSRVYEAPHKKETAFRGTITEIKKKREREVQIVSENKHRQPLFELNRKKKKITSKSLSSA